MTFGRWPGRMCVVCELVALLSREVAHDEQGDTVPIDQPDSDLLISLAGPHHPEGCGS